MVKRLLTIIRRLFSKKMQPDDRLKLPVYDEKKYDTLYNKTDSCKKHQWYFFSHDLDFTGTVFHNIGLVRSSDRICEKCFLWESKIRREDAEWNFMGFGKMAFDKLTEKKIESIAV